VLGADQVHVLAGDGAVTFLPGRSPERAAVRTHGVLHEPPEWLRRAWGMRAWLVAPLDTDASVVVGWVEPREVDGRQRAIFTGIVALAGHTDALTGFLDRDAFARSVASAGPAGCLLIDVDGLRSVNERWGRPTGDAVLQQVAAVVRTHLGAGDRAGRWGGDEVAVVLPGADAARAGVVGQRVLAAVRGVSVVDGDGEHHVTATVGAGGRLSTAEAALRAGKLEGGDRLVVGGH
jgi:diguanylate cyclase (GGDEF)-like protein